MFKKGQIWSYPTDTSFGLGVRADDKDGLLNLMKLKKRSGDKYFSLMVRDWEMLLEFAVVDESKLDKSFFISCPRTAILKPQKKLPKSSFWPSDKVAFRVCTIPEIAKKITYPITATSANISGFSSIYKIKDLEKQFNKDIKIYKKLGDLPEIPASEIWDFTENGLKNIR